MIKLGSNSILSIIRTASVTMLVILPLLFFNELITYSATVIAFLWFLSFFGVFLGSYTIGLMIEISNRVHQHLDEVAISGGSSEGTRVARIEAGSIEEALEKLKEQLEEDAVIEEKE